MGVSTITHWLCGAKKSSAYQLKEASMEHRIDKSPDFNTEFLQANYYNGNELTKLLVSNANRPLDAKISYDGIRFLQTCFLELRLPEYPNLEELIHYIGVFFDIFDQAFFFKAIGKKLRNISFEEHKCGLRANHVAEKRAINMVFIPGHDGYVQTLKDKVENLLHEMLHAFIYMYICNCNKCRADGTFVPTSGHRDNWVEPMLAIKDAASRALGYPLNTGIECSVNLEIQRTKWRPTKEKLQGWGIELGRLPLLSTRTARKEVRSYQSAVDEQ